MRKERDRQGLQKRLIIVWIVLAIVMATAITATSLSVLTSQIRKDRETAAVGAAKLAANAVDGNCIDGWLENGKDGKYTETFEALKDILNNTPNLKYLYIYQIREDGCHVVFDTDPEEAGELAELQEFDESFMPLLPDLMAGKEIDLIESDDAFGWLITKYVPIFNYEGKCVAYAGADISMDELKDYTRNYVLLIVAISSVFLIACIIIGLRMHINTNRAGELELLKEQQQRDKQLIREIIESFAKVIDMKDSYTQGHSMRVAKYTKMLAQELGYDDETVEQYYNIALLHDIGKIGIPDQVLNKPGKLTDEEYATIKSHTVKGSDVLNNISLMPDIIVGAESHHERPDGKGYPKGLKEGEIPRVAQIIAVADTFDAMYSDRPYRSRMNYDKAIGIIKDASGTQLTPDVVDAFMRIAERGEFRAPDDVGGGSTEDITNIHKNQE